MLLSPANSKGALTCLLPLIDSLGGKIRNIRTIMLMPSHRLTLRVRRIFGTVTANFPIVDYCNKHPTVRRRHAVENVSPTIVVNAPKHVGSRLGGRGFRTNAIHALIVSRFSGYLRFNFRSRVTRIVKGLPTLHHHFLLSTASTRRVPHFANVGHALGLSFLGPRRAISRHLSMCQIASPIGSGLRALCGLLYALNGRSALIFYGRHRDISQMKGCLRSVGICYRAFRNKVRRSSHRQTLCGFHGKDYRVFVSARLTTHKLSVPSVHRIIRCRLPITRSKFVRHGKHATH